MSKDMKHQHGEMGAHCHDLWGVCHSYMGHCGKNAKLWCWAIIILLLVLVAWGISMLIHSAPNHVVAACMAAVSVFLLLMVMLVTFQKKMMRRMLELKVAKFVPDVYATHDEKTKSLMVHVTASKTGSCVLQCVWECDSSSGDKKKESLKLKLPQPIKMGSEMVFKMPMPAKVKSGMGDKTCHASVGLNFYVPMLSRELMVKICPDSLCVCHHLMPCCGVHDHHNSCK